jgi:hypothetical protein
LLATFRETDTDPKEEWVLHNAGLSGLGSSSYINGVVCRYSSTARTGGGMSRR